MLKVKVKEGFEWETYDFLLAFLPITPLFQVWEEERLHEANEKGTLVFLENLDPTFTNAEVEVFHA